VPTIKAVAALPPRPPYAKPSNYCKIPSDTDDDGA
jgi:hypothetical protein